MVDKEPGYKRKEFLLKLKSFWRGWFGGLLFPKRTKKIGKWKIEKWFLALLEHSSMILFVGVCTGVGTYTLLIIIPQIFDAQLTDNQLGIISAIVAAASIAAYIIYSINLPRRARKHAKELIRGWEIKRWRDECPKCGSSSNSLKLVYGQIFKPQKFRLFADFEDVVYEEAEREGWIQWGEHHNREQIKRSEGTDVDSLKEFFNPSFRHDWCCKECGFGWYDPLPEYPFPDNK